MKYVHMPHMKATVSGSSKLFPLFRFLSVECNARKRNLIFPHLERIFLFMVGCPAHRNSDFVVPGTAFCIKHAGVIQSLR